MASNYFNTDQVLAMVLADGSDLEDEESVVEDFGDLETESDLENCSKKPCFSVKNILNIILF